MKANINESKSADKLWYFIQIHLYNLMTKWFNVTKKEAELQPCTFTQNELARQSYIYLQTKNKQ